MKLRNVLIAILGLAIIFSLGCSEDDPNPIGPVIDGFDLLSPADSSAMLVGDVVLTWEALDVADETVSYTVMVSDDAAGTNRIFETSTEELTATATGLSADITYYWKVIGAYSNGESGSSLWSFTLNDDFELLTPVDGAVMEAGSVTFTWEELAIADDVVSYTIDISISPHNALPLVYSETTEELTITVSSLNPDETYEWHVTATYSDSITSESATWTFSLEAATDAWVGEDGSHYRRLDASSYDTNTFFNLANNSLVDVTDQMSDPDWHLGFMRYNGFLNGGASGELGVVGVDLVDVDAATYEGMAFEDLTEIPDVGAAWETDTKTYIIGETYYIYNPSDHTVSASDNFWVLMTAAGDFVKFKFSNVENVGYSLANLELSYIFAASGSTDLSDDPVTVSFDETMTEDLYVNFSEGAFVSSTDEYDIRIGAGWNVELGEGVTAYNQWEDDETWETVTETPPLGGGYLGDSILSTFGNFSVEDSPWFEYGENHQLTTKGHLFLIKVSDTEIYKLKVEGYYHPETAASGFITIRYMQL